MGVAIAALALTVTIWGTQPPLVRIVLGDYSNAFVACVRSAMAGLLFAGWWVTRARRSLSHQRTAREKRTGGGTMAVWLVLGGIGLAASNLLWNAAMVRTTVGAVGVLAMTGPLLMAIFGLAVLSEPLTPARAVGLVLALGGMVVVTWGGQDLSSALRSRYLAGNLLALGSGAGWALCGVAQKMTSPRLGSVAAVTPMLWVAVAVTGVASLNTPVLLSPFRWTTALLLVATGAAGTGLGNVLFARAVQDFDISVTSAWLALAPPMTVVASRLILGEAITSYLSVGAVSTALGLVLVMLRRRPTRV